MESCLEVMDGLHDQYRQATSVDEQTVILGKIQVLQRKAVNLKPSKDKLYFVTVNFKPEVLLSQAQQVLQRLVSRKIVSKYWYNFEQRGDDLQTIGQGLHSHLVLLSQTARSEFHRDIYNTLKTSVGNSKHVDVKEYPLTYLDEKLAYLNGEKWDPDKYNKVQMDRLFRSKNNLEIIYNGENGEAKTASKRCED